MTEVDPSAVGEVRSRQYETCKFHETFVFLRLWAHHHMKYHFVVFVLAGTRIPMDSAVEPPATVQATKA
ncbi:hypothetical protein MJO28_017389 [Puccinia striiformis f. sp. tritici]|nr:hypothetical protein MJO28_017389 [Puccinia striiformis f. sp. tritici]